MITIDGSFGEGGGQILRTAIALSALTGEAVRIINIRVKRPNPGLRRQHLTGILAVAKLTQADVEGLEVGSTTVIFRPRSLSPGKYSFDVGTAGSITLILQTLFPVLAFMPGRTEIELRGGTDVPWSPPMDYVRYVMQYYLRKQGFSPEINLIRRGHYPKGGGIVRVLVNNPPRRLLPVVLTKRNKVKKIEGISHCVRLPKHVAERQAKIAIETIKSAGYDVPINIKLEWYEPDKDPHLGPGSGIVIWAEAGNAVLGGDSLGARGKRAELVGKEAAMKLINDLKAGTALDKFMSDNIIPYIALADGVSEITGSSLTLHAYTNLEIVKKILNVKVYLKGELGKPFHLRMEGIGLRI
jgi:RNA 3'-terminal phosphate cyclase (ATP)